MWHGAKTLLLLFHSINKIWFPWYCGHKRHILSKGLLPKPKSNSLLHAIITSFLSLNLFHPAIPSEPRGEENVLKVCGDYGIPVALLGSSSASLSCLNRRLKNPDSLSFDFGSFDDVSAAEDLLELGSISHRWTEAGRSSTLTLLTMVHPAFVERSYPRSQRLIVQGDSVHTAQEISG